MSLQKYFEKFHDTIKLNSSTKAELKEKRDILIGILRDSDKLPGFDEFSQGSYGMHLGNEPTEGREYDIDVGLRFNVNKGDYEPLDLKETICEILENHTEYGAKIRKPCVTVTYKKDGEKAYHVDLVTYVYEDKNNHDSQMYLARGTDNPNVNVCWESADPVALLDYIQDYIGDADERDQFRRVVKYLKRWKNLRFKSSGHEEPASIGITLLALKGFSAHEKDDLTALIEVVDYIISKFYYVGIGETGRLLYAIKCSMPEELRFESENNAFDKMSEVQMTDFKDKIEKLAADLQEVQEEADLVKQCEKLRKIFGDEFEVPEAKDVSKKQMNYIPRSTASGMRDVFE